MFVASRWAAGHTCNYHGLAFAIIRGVLSLGFWPRYTFGASVYAAVVRDESEAFQINGVTRRRPRGRKGLGVGIVWLETNSRDATHNRVQCSCQQPGGQRRDFAAHFVAIEPIFIFPSSTVATKCASPHLDKIKPKIGLKCKEYRLPLPYPDEGVGLDRY